jgi:hypothetical protein
MKFRITMKDPDGPYECIQDEAKKMVAAIEGITDAEREPIAESRADMLRDFAGRWMSYDEYITVEFDTEAGTATVIEDRT